MCELPRPPRDIPKVYHNNIIEDIPRRHIEECVDSVPVKAKHAIESKETSFEWDQTQC